MEMEQIYFIPESKEERLEREVIRLKEQCEKVRKSQFAKIGKIDKVVNDLQHELETLRAAMCRGKAG